MKTLTGLLALAALLLLVVGVYAGHDVFSLSAGEHLDVACAGDTLVVTQDGLNARLDCIAAAPTATDTPTPTFTPTATPVDGLCAHNPTVWHALQGAGCHYNHEHKDDPNGVNDIFGPVGGWWGGGQTLSYPWQTPNENVLKHEGYGWLVRRDMPCKAQFADGCLTDFRAQFHSIMAAPGATTRFHSYSLEARGCLKSNPAVCGILRVGGWQDYGYLVVDGVHVPLAGDPSSIVPGASRRVHSWQTASLIAFGTWYGSSRFAAAQVSFMTDSAWGGVDPADPYRLNLICPDYQCSKNGGAMQAHSIAFQIWSYWDGDGDGLVTRSGYVDRYGNEVSGCTAAGLDCVPFQIVNMPVGNYNYRDSDHGISMVYYDTSPPDEWYISYPN